MADELAKILRFRDVFIAPTLHSRSEERSDYVFESVETHGQGCNIAVNVKGVFVATQEAVRHLGEGGRIIMIGSINSDLISFVGGSVYALTKSAVAGFTRGLARDLGPC